MSGFELAPRNSHPATRTMDLSIVIPLLDEEESLPELEAWIRRVVEAKKYSYEIIMVDDGSTDSSWQIIEDLSVKNPCVRGIKFRRNYGKSAALHVGFQAAEGDVVITMDADMQDSPDEIPALFKLIKEEGWDMISGWKKTRHDPISKTLPSKFFNALTRKISGIKLNDFNCGLKAYKKEVVKNIEIYGEMHRYIPVIAKWAGYRKIGEKAVQHRARKYGKTKFGLERFINGFLDLLLITFISRFGKKPMHFFGPLGVLVLLIGGGIAAGLIIAKLYAISTGAEYRDVVDQPLFYLALISMIAGIQFFLAGFLGELLVRNSSSRNNYLIESRLD